MYKPNDGNISRAMCKDIMIMNGSARLHCSYLGHNDNTLFIVHIYDDLRIVVVSAPLSHAHARGKPTYVSIPLFNTCFIV